MQLTHGGGQGPRESPDGHYLYFARVPPNGSSSLWRIRTDGGEETQILDSLLGENFEVKENGIWYVGACGSDGLCPMYSYSFASGRRILLAKSLAGDNGLAVSPDRLTLLRGQITELGTDLMVLEGFR